MIGKPFEPGNKFGKGRPKGSGFVARCRAWADQKGWDKLEKWADGEDGKLAFEATKLLLAYGYGKPVAEIDSLCEIESNELNWCPESAAEIVRQLQAFNYPDRICSGEISCSTLQERSTGAKITT